MSETLPKNEGVDNSGTEWDDMVESLDIEQRLEDGDDPEAIIKEQIEKRSLTPDFMEEYGSTLMQYGLNEDKLEYYEKLSRQHDDSLEDKRRRFDEETEQEGYESEIA